ncbi:MAG: helix-turn-helix domain-containing protein [Candidatus Dojkabacteria bacterium]|nr:MAG: helix-turn-helix domain-containing protein [Candidatus Dojkabacteria bacterium]
MDISNIFRGLGLDEEHAKIYVASLEWGETSITNLAERAGIPRTTAYPFVEELVALGILKKSLKHGKKNYVPAEPEFLGELLERKSKEIQNLSSELNEKMDSIQLFMRKGENKPRLTYLEGADGIKQAYEMSFEAEKLGEEVWIQCLTEDYKGVVDGGFFDSYFKRFFASKIKSKEILTAGDEEYAAKWGSEKNLQLLVDVGDRPTETDFMVYGNKVIFVSFNKEAPYALVVEDKEIAYCVKNLYSLAWRSAAVSDPRVKRGERVRTEF